MTMQARDAAGRQVSLLNDDSSSRFGTAHQYHHLSYAYSSRPPLHPQPAPRSGSSSPNTPELLRSDSYDSQMSNSPLSPLTPSVDYNYARGPVYSINHDYGADAPPAKRQAYADCSRAASCEDDSAASSALERPPKRYPCRYRDSHGCEKTFTTSGHASRHSKIHTAEKAVQCTFLGCHKKFTRADNMKQHLETHYKEKNRSSSSTQRTSKAALVDARRSSTSSSRSRSSTTGRDSSACWESTDDHHQRQYPLPTPPLPPPTGTPGAAWDMRGLDLQLLNRPAVTPNNGLDALAMAIACQEGGRA